MLSIKMVFAFRCVLFFCFFSVRPFIGSLNCCAPISASKQKKKTTRLYPDKMMLRGFILIIAAFSFVRAIDWSPDDWGDWDGYVESYLPVSRFDDLHPGLRR